MTATVTDRWWLSHFGKKTLEAVSGRVANAAFCNKSGDEMARGNVEGIIGRGAGVGGQLYVSEPAILSSAGYRSDFRCTPLLDGNISHAVFCGPVDCWRGQPDIEWHAIVLGSQCLEIGSNFITHIARVCSSVRARNAEVNHTMLHQMAARVINDDRVIDAVLAQLPGR